MIKRIFVILITIMTILSTSCSSSAVQSVGKELEDSIANISDSDNKYVLMVKNGYRVDNPDLTYNKAFTDFFATPRWKYFKSDDDLDVVEFTGDCTYRDVAVKARLQFVVDEEKGTFEAVYLTFNEVPQDMFTLAALIGKVFEFEAENELTSANASVRPSDKPSEDKPTPDLTDLYASTMNSMRDTNGEYAFYDIDSNGIAELFIRYETAMDGYTKIYTYVDGNIYELVEFWSRSTLDAIDNEGIIYRSGSNGAANYSFEAFRISDDKKSLVAVGNGEMDHSSDSVLGSLSWLPIPSSPPSTLLSVDEAMALYNAWLNSHTDVSSYTLNKQSYETYEFNGEQYYLFHANEMSMYWYNILVKKDTGRLLLFMTPDGEYPTPSVEPLDDWYNRFYSTPVSVPSTMSIRDYSLPPDQYVGAIFGVRGIIESNYVIWTVTVAVYDDRGYMETGSTDYPYEYSYDIRNLDYDILFDELTPGLKTYVIEATDEMDTKYIEHEFWVYSR